MKTFKQLSEELKMKGKDPCWKGYEMVGTKKKAGRTVPNCVPKEGVGFTDPTGASAGQTSTGADVGLVNTTNQPVQSAKKKTKLYKEEVLIERGADSKGYYRSTESGAGLTRKGAKHFGIHTAVTGKVKPGSKAAKRRKSFCARMSGMPGPMKDSQGRDTRKAASLKRWRCRT
jgi:hypothetical protein